MKENIKNKLLLVVTTCLCLMFGIGGYFALKQTPTINAYTNNISVDYGTLETTTESTTDESGTTTNTTKVTKFTSSKTINDDTFVLLPTDDTKGIKVHFELSNKEDSIISLSTSLTINGVPMDTQEQMQVDKEQNSFTQYIYYGLELKENPTDTSSNVTYTNYELQGEYIYTFQYVSTLTNSKQVETVKFYVGFESEYLNPETKINPPSNTYISITADNNTTEPKIYNTEKIFRYVDSNKKNVRKTDTITFTDNSNKEFNYFHFSNDNIVDYFDNDNSGISNATKDNLLFPTYTYDASRYNLSWTYSINGITTYYTTQFTSDGTSGKVTIYKSSSSSSVGNVDTSFGDITATATNFNTNSDKNTVNNYKENHYFVNIQFDQVGEYQFSLQPVITTSENQYYVVPTQEVNSSDDVYNAIAEYYYLFGKVELRIFGYELFYTNYNGGNEEILQFITRDSDNNLITADRTNKVKIDYNNNTISSVLYATSTDLLTTTPDYNTVSGIFDSKIVTNQAPIMFSKYSAQMVMQKNTVTSKSICIYYPTNSSNATVTNITNSTKFSQNGYYIVVNIYKYIHYKTFNTLNGSIQSGNDKEFAQVFAFQIKNTEPSVTVKSNEKDLYSNEMTKENINFSWTVNNNLFDVIPNISVYAKVNGGDYYNVTNNGTYVTKNTDTSITLKPLSNNFVRYKVELQYGPNKNTIVIYNYTIDSMQINSSVYNVNKSNDNKFTIDDSPVSEENNFAVVSQNFYLNINNNNNEKASGAIISAKYDFFPLVSDSDLLDKTYTDNDMVNVYNGYKIDLNNQTTFDYEIATKMTDNFEGKNASAVLTNPGLYYFTITDSAGNTSHKVVLYENTAPIILVNDKPSDTNNTSKTKNTYKLLSVNNPIYLNTINVAFGNYKAIDLISTKNVDMWNTLYEYFKSSSYYDSDNNLFRFKNYPTLNDSKNENSARGNYSLLQNNNGIYGYKLKLEKPKDECTYTLYVTSNNIKSYTKKIKMSTDNSQMLAIPLQKEITSSDSVNTGSYIDEFNYTNSNFLIFNWVNDIGGDYEIDSISLNYYPLTYDIKSNYYPYSENATSTIDLLSGCITVNKTDGSDNQTGVSSYASISFNAQGMYVVERTYKNEISQNSNNLDMKTRRYIYFLDKNEIFKEISLSQKDNFIIGELINLLVGTKLEADADYQLTLNYNDFILKGNGVSLFDTSKLPVTLKIDNLTLDSYYKYAQSNIKNANDTTKDDRNSIFTNVHSSYSDGSWLDKIKSAFKMKIYVNGQELGSTNYYNITKNSNYTITIKDANYDDSNQEKFSSWNKDSSVEWNLLFNVSTDAPTVDFIKSTSNNSYRLLDDKPIINYTEGVKFAWNNPVDKYTAQIDKSKIKITVNDKEINFDANTITSNDFYDNVVDLETLLSPFTNGDLLVKIHLEYYGNNGYENYASVKQIYIDRTKPNLNYEFLKQNDTFLSQSEKSSFDDYNSNLSFDNYSFNVNKDFMLQLDNDNSDFITNTNYIYVRHYDKFNDSLNSSNYINYQSIVNSDDRYLNNDIIRLKFDPAYVSRTLTDNNTYAEVILSGEGRTINIYEYIQKISSYKYGYFEIIEQDESGNQNIFTLYIPNYIQDENSNIVEEKIVFKNEYDETISSEINAIALPEFYIDYETPTDTSNIEIRKRFLTLRIEKDGNIFETYKISPIELDGYINIDQAISIIKETATQFNDISGTNYIFNLYFDALSNNGSSRLNSKLVYNYPSEKISLICTPSVNNSTKNLLVSWNNNTSTYLTNIKVEVAKIDGSYETRNSDDNNQLIGNLIDANGNISSPTYIFNVQSGEAFRFTLTDNFNRIYTQNYVIGLAETKEIIYSKNTVEDNGVIYTAGQVTINAQSKIYKTKIYDLLGDNPTTPLDDDGLKNLGITYSTNSSNSITTYTLFNLNQQYKLKIEITSLDEQTILLEKTIQYVNNLSAVQLRFGGDILFDTNVNISSPLNSTLNTPTLYIVDDELPESCKTTVKAVVTTTSGETFNLGQILSGTTLTMYGRYTLTISNPLGLSKTFVFEIRDSKANDFTVYTTTGKILNASSVKYSYGDTKIDWFFSTEDYEIEYSGRFATCEQALVDDANNTIIYKLSTLNDTGDPTKTKTKFFAVTKVASSSNFISEANFTINSTQLSTNNNSIKLFDKQVVLKMEKNYNKYEGNIITVSYSFNGSDLITIPFDSITQYNITDAGIYTFYFTDVAGNTQVFNNTSYLTISLFNKVIISVNNGQQINNAVYNTVVSVAINSYQDYIYEGQSSLRVNILKDGKSYSTPSKNGVYTFNEYGVYSMTFSGTMNGRTLENSLNFTILNENEARVSYEYIGNSGYEITKIVKDGVDYYEEIRKAMSSQVFENDLLLTSLSSIVLSGSSLENYIGGNGKYEITVTARNLYNNLDFDFTFKLWINAGDEVYILSSIDAGTSTTNEIEIRLNTNQIFEKIGTCNITINNKTWLYIDKDGNVFNMLGDNLGITQVTSNTNKAYSIYKLTKNGSYNIKIETVSGGNTLMSFTVTKTEPLNGTAILVIVIVVIVVGAIITLFILLRKKMRVK